MKDMPDTFTGIGFIAVRSGDGYIMTDISDGFLPKEEDITLTHEEMAKTYRDPKA